MIRFAAGFVTVLGIGYVPFLMPLAALPFAVTWVALLPFIGTRAVREAGTALVYITMICVAWLAEFATYALLSYAGGEA